MCHVWRPVDCIIQAITHLTSATAQHGHTEFFDAPPVLRLSRYVSKEYLEQVHWQSDAFKTVRAQLAVQQGFCVTIQGLLRAECLLDCHVCCALSCIVSCTEASGMCLLRHVVMMCSLVPRTVRMEWSGRSRRCSSTMRLTSGSCPSETCAITLLLAKCWRASSLQRHYQLLLCSALCDHLARKSCIALC